MKSMEKISREQLRKIILKEYNGVLETVRQHDENLKKYDKVIKELQELKLFLTEPVSLFTAKNNAISKASYELKRLYISNMIIGELVKQYDDEKIDDAITEAMKTIDYIYTVKGKSISKQTYDVVQCYKYNGNKYYISNFELKNELEKMIILYNLDIKYDNIMDLKLDFGANQINDKYTVKIFKNGKIQVIEK